MVSVTQAFTVDLSGQVCTERLDGSLYGGVSTGLPPWRAPDWQGGGLATALHARTVEYARGHGVRGLVADVLMSNPAMLAVFRHGAGHGLRMDADAGVYEVRMLFTEKPGPTL